MDQLLQAIDYEQSLFYSLVRRARNENKKHTSSNKAFIYSLYNIYGYNPVKRVVSGGSAVMRCPSYGPTFGSGHDIYISDYAKSNQQSYTYCGHTYPLPPGYSNYGSKCTFYAGRSHFTPTDIEVFYETTT